MRNPREAGRGEIRFTYGDGERNDSFVYLLAGSQR